MGAGETLDDRDAKRRRLPHNVSWHIYLDVHGLAGAREFALQLWRCFGAAWRWNLRADATTWDL